MKNKYVYRGQDITTDVTYAALQKTESVMWAESAEFIADEYFREFDEEPTN